MQRRDFIKTGSLFTAGIMGPGIALSAQDSDLQLSIDAQKINFTRDGLDLTPLEYSTLLNQIIKENDLKPDVYSRGGVVEQLENRMAEILGKESAVFMPTGTLANHIAVRKLVGNNKKILLQENSHLYRDSGDCATILSGLNMIPLDSEKTGFSLLDVEEKLREAKSGRVKTGIGAISIESPVRRENNRMFDYSDMKEISEFAKENHIGMHLDGARLFNACVHLDKPPAEIANMFDTVYVSLYKNFNAPSGAILAGKREFTKELYHTRRMFGGGMPSVWSFTAVALYYLDGFLEEYMNSIKKADQLFNILGKNGDFTIEKFQDGTNVVKLYVKNRDTEAFRSNLKTKNIYLPAENQKDKIIYIKINPSILRNSVENIAAVFITK